MSQSRNKIAVPEISITVPDEVHDAADDDANDDSPPDAGKRFSVRAVSDSGADAGETGIANDNFVPDEEDGDAAAAEGKESRKSSKNQVRKEEFCEFYCTM